MANTRITDKPELTKDYDKVVLLGSDPADARDYKITPEGLAKIVSGRVVYDTECTTAAETAAKVITIEGFTELVPGLMLWITFTNGNTAANPTLSVNGQTAIPLKVQGGDIPSLFIEANKKYKLEYIGNEWNFVNQSQSSVELLDNIYGVAVNLDNGDYNVNDLKEVGRYTWTTKVPAGIVIEGRTEEDNKYGSLTVTKVGSGNDRKQVINFGIDNSQFSRTNPGGNNPWGKWKQTATKDMLSDGSVTKLALGTTMDGKEVATVDKLTDGSVTKVSDNVVNVSGKKIATTDNTFYHYDNIITEDKKDLNTYTEPGTFCKNSAQFRITTSDNAPVDSYTPFVLRVYNDGGNYIKGQEIIYLEADDAPISHYIRTKWGKDWYNWQEVPNYKGTIKYSIYNKNTIIPDNTDVLEATKENGLFQGYNLINAPSPYTCLYSSLYRNDENRALMCYGPNLNKVWVNLRYGGAWSGWNEIATTQNSVESLKDSATMETAGTSDNSIMNVAAYNKRAYKVGPGRNLMTVLGASSLTDLASKIKALGTDYSLLQPGDYISIPSLEIAGIGAVQNVSGNLDFEIAGFDHYNGVGDTDSGRGILFVNKNCMFRHRMNPLNSDGNHTNAGGYNGCELKGILNGAVAEALEKTLGVSLKTVHRLVDTHGSWAWAAEKCFLPTEVEIFGYQAWGRGGYYGGTSAQYPIYALDPSRRCKKYNGARQWYWEGTSDSSSSTYFCSCSYGGYANSYYAGIGDGGVSPAFYL